MDHIWGAPSSLKKLLAPIFLKKLAIILRQDFLRTLYVVVRLGKGDIWRPVLNLNLELFTQRLNILISVTNPIFRIREFTGVKQRTRVGKSDLGMQL